MALTPQAVNGVGCSRVWGIAVVLQVATLPAVAVARPLVTDSHRLPNGLRVVTAPFESPGLVAAYTVVRVGSRDELRRGVTGFAHLMEHVMFRGTRAWPKERVRAFLMESGAMQTARTHDDFTLFAFVGGSDALDDWIDYEADRLQNLAFTAEDLQREARAIIQKHTERLTQIDAVLLDHLRSLLYQRHAYRHTPRGYRPDVDRMPAQHASARKFFRQFYVPKNVTLVVVGDFDRPRLLQGVQERFGAWKGRRSRIRVRRERRQRREIRSRLETPVATRPLLSLSWRTPRTKFGSPKTAAYDVLFELLFGTASPLYRSLVLEQGVVTRFEEWSENHRDPYCFHVVAALSDARTLGDVERKILAQIKRLRKAGPSSEALERAKAHLRYRDAVELASPDRVARALAFTIGASGGVSGMVEHRKAVDRLTEKDIRRYARKYLKRKNRAVISVVPSSGAS